MHDRVHEPPPGSSDILTEMAFDCKMALTSNVDESKWKHFESNVRETVRICFESDISNRASPKDCLQMLWRRVNQPLEEPRYGTDANDQTICLIHGMDLNT